MPTYEYACDQCGIVEIFQSMRDDALKKCPTCGSKKFSRMISGGGAVIFKGEGFWETDYNRSKDYSTKKQEETGTTKKADTAPAADGAAKKPAATKPETPATPSPKPQPAAAPAAAKPKPGGGKPAGPAA